MFHLGVGLAGRRKVIRVARTLLSAAVVVAVAFAFSKALTQLSAGVVSAARFSRTRVSAPHGKHSASPSRWCAPAGFCKAPEPLPAWPRDICLVPGTSSPTY